MRLVVQHTQRLYREGLGRLLTGLGDVDLVSTASSPEEVIARAGTSPPQAVILDLDGSGEAACRAALRLRGRFPDVLIVALHGPGLDAARTRALAPSGARLVDHRHGVGPVIKAIREAGAKPAPVVPLVAPSTARGPRLSPRELSVLRLVACGHTTQEISRRLELSPKTVENHKRRMFAKLGVQNQAHAVSIGIANGWIEPRASFAVAVGD